MRWLAVLRKVKQHQASVERRATSKRVGTASHAAASPLTTTISNDEQHRAFPSLQHQANSAFGSLHYDLFISILKLAISVESDFSSIDVYDIRGLFVVNAVCRHWRWTALNSPSLWAYIPSYLPLDILELSLQRSAGELLHVDLRYNSTFSDIPHNTSNIDLLRKENIFLAKLDSIISHFHRIQYLSISLSATALISTEINSRLAGSPRGRADCRTPVLEGLRFISSAHPRWRPPNENTVKDTELSIFTNLRSPLLRELHLGLITIPRDSIPVSSLTSLSLTLGNTYTIINSEEYLRGLLRGSPRLVSLCLDLWSVRTEFKLGEGSIHPVILPRLRQLTMRGSTCNTCSSVYGILSVPSVEEIYLETGHSTVERAANFIPVLPAGDRLRITVDQTTIQLEFIESESLTRGARKHFSFTLVTQFGTDTNISNNRLLPQLVQSRHFSRITSVDFSTSSRFDSTFMLQLLSHFETLHELSMSFTPEGSAKESIFPVEDAISLSMLQSPSSPLYSLRSLVYHSFAVVMPQARFFLIGLSAIVRGRGRSGLPPLVLKFKDCEGVTDTFLRASGLKSL